MTVSANDASHPLNCGRHRVVQGGTGQEGKISTGRWVRRQLKRPAPDPCNQKKKKGEIRKTRGGKIIFRRGNRKGLKKHETRIDERVKKRNRRTKGGERVKNG